MTADVGQAAAAQDARVRIDRFLQEQGLTGHSPRVVALSGDASDRRYVRVLMEGAPSQVLAVHPGAIEFERMPFASVARLLAGMPIPIPRVLGHSDPLGIIAQEDLGDLTLQAHLESTSPTDRAARYREAVAIIATLQRRGAELASPEYVPYGLAFDEEKLVWELQFFLTHFVEGHRGAAVPAGERAAFETAFRQLARELAGEPRVVCHRDYHSRNLMLHDRQLYVIDFQDARMGPDTYDLASLLRDSYVDVTEDEVDSLIEWFVTLTSRGAVSDAARRRFRERFDVMSLQRNLKALGTFGYQAAVRGNQAYLRYVPRTLAHVRRNLHRYERVAPLRRLLAAHVTELE